MTVHKIILSLLILFLVINLKGQDFVVDSMIVHIEVSEKGTAVVREKIFVDFLKKRRGIIRHIPTSFRVNQASYTTPINGAVVESHPYKTNNSNGAMQIRIGDKDVYIDGKVIYDLTYEVVGPFIRSETYDEFYWNITGNEWTAPINFVAFTIELPEKTKIRYNDVRFFTGSLGANQKNADVRADGNTISGKSLSPIQPGQGLTVAVKLPTGFVKTSNISMPKKSAAEAVTENWSWSIFPVTLFMMFWGWWRGLRGSRVEADVVSVAYPPKGMSPVEAGTFIDNIPHDRDVLSLLPFWANASLLSIEKKDDDLYFQKIKNFPDDGKAYERQFFDALFQSGDRIALSDLKGQLSQTIWAVKSSVKKKLVEEELYDARYRWFFKSWRAWMVFVLFVAIAVVSFIFHAPIAGIASIITSIGVLVINLLPSPPSEKGLALRAKLKGLKKHLADEDSDVIAGMIKQDPGYYERLYPFAMALGLDQSWSERVSQVYSHVPVWYSSTNNTLKDFSSSFTPKEISSAFVQQPTSSGGGFSSGSSGGGFGGGGGSSW